MNDAKQPLTTNREITSLVETFRREAEVGGFGTAATHTLRWCSRQLEAAIQQVERWREADEREGAIPVNFDWLSPRVKDLYKVDGVYYCEFFSTGPDAIDVGTVGIPVGATRAQVLHLIAALGMEKKQ